MNVKLRLTGTSKDLDLVAEQLNYDFVLSGISKKVKNRNSSFYRMYVTVTDIKPHQEKIQ